MHTTPNGTGMRSFGAVACCSGRQACAAYRSVDGHRGGLVSDAVTQVRCLGVASVDSDCGAEKDT
jgi:hypothetical protein